MILIVDMNWKKDSLGFYEFVLPLALVVEELDEYTIKHYLEVTKEDLNQCDRVILSGTALKDTASLCKPEKFQWLKKTNKPVLGVCAGMETIGVVYGMPLVKCLEIGMTQITTLKENLFVSCNFKAYSLHSYCIQFSDGFEVWATSAKCAQIVKHKQNPIYGVLFHPEVRNQELINVFCKTNS